ncbi:hypothetical protein NKR23_g9270 [Pleurostoma richardsiae]|uniref:Oxidase ustYa n=1 Tax=Pleurostoma richardsiae TaxID=41990 RepID=A0AA38VF11_9PEZI|nr:hypothetical protein NKR23_g9270 [Pleurostoma richardsiae]
MIQDQQYAQLPPDGRADADDEAETALIGGGDEKEWQADRPRGRGTRSKVGRLFAVIISAPWILNTLLLLAVLGLLVDRQLSTQEYGRFEGSGDLTGFAPRFSQQITTFKPDPMFVPENTSEFFTNTVRQKWLSLVPKGLGYLKVEQPEKYNNLPTPLPEFSHTVFTTSMTHQLHCLHAIAEVFAALTSDPSKVPPETSWHLGHCFDYLRQSIMCCADVALEGTATTFPEGVTGSDGWDAKHVCKDYGQVLDYLNENRANDQVWI